MTSPIWATAMLATAEKLANGSGAGRPALCDLRRATSTAYYALFHQITRHAAFVLSPQAGEAEVARLTRWFTHTAIDRAAEAVVMGSSNRQPKRELLPAVDWLTAGGTRTMPLQLLTVAESFVELQDLRHQADYSNDFDPRKFVTLGHVLSARQAVEASWYLWRSRDVVSAARNADHDAYRRFLLLSLMHSGGPKVR